jgi:hypothetical protein
MPHLISYDTNETGPYRRASERIIRRPASRSAIEYNAMGEWVNITQSVYKRTEEENKKRWDGIMSEIKEESAKILDQIEKTNWTRFKEGLLVFWDKHKDKIELLVIIAIIILDREWTNQPAWYPKVLFYGSLLYAVLTNRDLAAAVSQIGNWLDKRKQIATIMDVAKASIDVGEEEARAVAEKLNEILANDPPERRQEIIDLIKPLVNSTVNTRDSLVEVCNILTEMDTK